MKEVQVLLSSYNGENYIKEQIDSILAQKGVAVKLLVRDDGSSDGTVELLRNYELSYDNIQIMYGCNIGVIESFFALINAAEETDYIAFADQDDVWLPDKLLRAVTLLEERNPQCPNDTEPMVYCSARQLVDENLNPLPSAIKYPQVQSVFGNALVENMCTGCTCVMNKKMLQLLDGYKPDYTIMHDFWIYLVGSCFGTVLYDEESRILYRQHGGNELGEASSLIGNYKRRIKNFKKHRGQLTKQTGELLRLYGNRMPKEKKQLAEEFVQGKRNRKLRWKLARSGTVFRQRKSDDWIMKCFLLLGWV